MASCFNMGNLFAYEIMKIIFLDVDGVLNHSESVGWKTELLWVLDDACLEQLRRIIGATKATIVLSSTWRLSEDGCKALITAFQEYESHYLQSVFCIIGKTAMAHFNRGRGGPRREEILDWLQDTWPYSYGWNGEVITHMAVIDDDDDADLGDGSFFKTDFQAGGLTKEIADAIIIHLSK